MTGDIERQLTQLVAQFGEKKVLAALDRLVTQCKMERLAMRCECNPSYHS
jgi:hypothetical protein